MSYGRLHQQEDSHRVQGILRRDTRSVKETRAALMLVPEDIPDSAKGAESH